MARRTAVAVILNRSAGAAKSQPDIERDLRDLFRAAGCDVEIADCQSGQALRETVGRVRESADVVAAAGGDGTVSGIAAALHGTATPLGVLPLGTLNHFARDLRIPSDLRQAVAAIAANNVDAIDVGEVNGRVFVNNVSIGVYPDIVQERLALQRSGYRKWPAMALATLRVLRRYPGVTVRIDADGVHETRRTPFVVVGNNEYAIDGIRVGARARLDGGLLFIYLAPRLHARDLPVLVAEAVAGRARASGALEIVPARDLSMEAAFARTIHIGLDGEVVTASSPLRFHLRPRALNVVVP